MPGKARFDIVLLMIDSSLLKYNEADVNVVLTLLSTIFNAPDTIKDSLFKSFF